MRYRSLVLLLFLYASVGVACADYLSVNFDHNPCEAPYGSCDLQPYVTDPGSPAKGDAAFPAMTGGGSQWSYSFQTSDPYYGAYDQGSYYAKFDGGVFQMNGPGNLTFLGQITDGSVTISWEAIVGIFDFAGEWNNNLQASGNIEIYLGGRGNQWSSLDVITGSTPTGIPEPAGLSLLGSAVAGAWAGRRQHRI